MQLLSTYEQASWFIYLNHDQKLLTRLSIDLYNRESSSQQMFPDYSFVIFPMSKAYEGFLKRFLYDSKLIPEYIYKGRRFRIGRALNPSLEERFRDEHWVYDDVVKICGKPVANTLWDTWLTCRNHVFHYFSGASHFLTLTEAGDRLQMMMGAMDQAVKCLADT